MNARPVLCALVLAGATVACSSGAATEVILATTTTGGGTTSTVPPTTEPPSTTTSTLPPPTVPVLANNVDIPGDQIAFMEGTAIAVFESNDPSEFNPAWFAAGEGLRDEFGQSKGAADFLGWSGSSVEALSSQVMSDSLVVVEVELTNPEGGQVRFNLDFIWADDRWAVSTESWCAIASQVDIVCAT